MAVVIKNRWVKSYLKDGGKDGSIPKEHLEAVRERAERRAAKQRLSVPDVRTAQELKEDMAQEALEEDIDEYLEEEADAN